MGEVSERRYPPPIYGADWSVSAQMTVEVALGLALPKHIIGWPGATDDQISEVARDVLAALDKPTI